MSNAIRTYPMICRGVEERIGKKISPQKREFTLLYFTKGNKAQAARDIGIKETSAKQRGYQMANDDDVKTLLEELESIDMDMSEVTEDTIKKGILKEAVGADASRDRLNAWQMLGKTKGMFVDVQENRNPERDLDDKKLLDEIEQEFGKEARNKAAIDLGHDVDEESGD